MKKDLIIFIAHIDDCECASYGYLFKHYQEYDKIKIITATTWENKIPIWEKNKQALPASILNKITDINLQFDQRTLFTNLDLMKDAFYKKINFDRRFDLLTHDDNDSHTDHVAVSLVAKGMYKYCNRFVTIYSPSSVHFDSNYYIGLSSQAFSIKRKALDEYDISKEQSYSKWGYYLQSEEHYNIGRAYVLENFAFDDYKNYEIYRILKWL